MGETLKGRVAIVTGASRGFGRAIATRLAGEGAAVAVTARTRSQLDAVVEDITHMRGRAIAIEGDATVPADVARVTTTTEQQLGPVDLLVSNAGVPGPFGPLWLTDPEAWWASQQLHIRAPLLYMHHVLKGMTERRRGHVILVSARASQVAAPYLGAYCIGKSAQTRLAQITAAETRDLGVSLFAIDPGYVFTGMAEDTTSHPDAQRWLPGMVERLLLMRDSPHRNSDLARCAQRCLELASGKYDALSGHYFELGDDLDAALGGLSKETSPARTPVVRL